MDSEQEKNQLQNKLYEQQSEYQQLKASQMYMDEKLKLLEIDRSRLELQLEERVRALNQAKDNVELNLTSQLKEAVQKQKDYEEKYMTIKHQFERDQALLSQKQEFLESENQKLNQKINNLTAENKKLIENQLTQNS